MPPKPKLNVHSFPRPPLLEKTPRHLHIKHTHPATKVSTTIADTRSAYWVLETTHPPTYYFPRDSISVPLTRNTGGASGSVCEWKGEATYWNLSMPSGSGPDKDGVVEVVAKNKAWSYENPTPRFAALKGYVSFYADGPWECFVDGEKVDAQEGNFYGGWITSELEGRMKGGVGTWGW